jgi:hypothetical protein
VQSASPHTLLPATRYRQPQVLVGRTETRDAKVVDQGANSTNVLPDCE